MKKFFKYNIDLYNTAFISESVDYTASESKRRELLLHLLIFTALLFLIPFGFYALFKGYLIQGTADLAAATILLILDYYLRKYNNHPIVTKILVTVLSGLFLYLFLLESQTLSGHLWSFIVPIAVLFLLPGRSGLYFTLIFLAIIDVFFILDYPPDQYDLYFKIRYTGVFLAIIMIAYFLEMVRLKTHHGLLDKNIELDRIITELNIKEEELEESGRKYRLLFEETNDAIIIMDGFKFVDFNKKALELFGYTADEFRKLNALSLTPLMQPDGRHSRIKAYDYLMEASKKSKTRFQWLNKRKDSSEFYADINLHYIDTNKFFATIRDITAQKEAENQLIKAKEEAEKSDKLKSEFLAQMSHEIRTPINAILNFSSLLKVDLEDKINEDDSMAFTAIENSASRLMRTIDLILNISEVETGTIAPVFIKTDISDDIIKNVLRELRPFAIEKNINLNYENQLSKKTFLQLDSYTITQTISNLLDNAIKYTYEGEVTLVLYQSDDNIILDIQDTGIGISQEYLPKIFDKFSQEQQGYTRDFEGNGLGLALVKEYCNINNVDLRVESNKGMGSKFSLVFPQSGI